MNPECVICHCVTRGADTQMIDGEMYCDVCAELAERRGYIYLASPYTHPEKEVRRLRFDIACAAAAHLMRSGRVVFSPIAHSHPIHFHGLDGMDHGFWMRQDGPLLDAADSVVVLMLPGWDTSAGVAWEIDRAIEAGKPVEYLRPEDAGIKE